MLPYLATIVVLVLISRNASFIRVNMPASIGKPFFPGSIIVASPRGRSRIPSTGASMNRLSKRSFVQLAGIGAARRDRRAGRLQQGTEDDHHDRAGGHHDDHDDQQHHHDGGLGAGRRRAR